MKFRRVEISKILSTEFIYTKWLTVPRRFPERHIVGNCWPPRILDDELKREFQIAALCHNIGHTALSHIFEPILLPEGQQNHEECTITLLRSDTEIANCISEICDLESVIQLLSSKHQVFGLCRLLVGEYDIDRWDYLLRDSHETGVRYGIFDLDWMIHSLIPRMNNENRPNIIFDLNRGAVALRQFLAARRSMYQQVYWHRAVCGAEQMLLAIFHRAMDPRRPGYNDEMEKSLVPQPLQKRLFRNESPSIQDFLNTDDILILSVIRSWANHSIDPILHYLSNCFVHRRLFKRVDLNADIAYGRVEFTDDMLSRVRTVVRTAVETILPTEVLDDNGLSYLVLLDKKPFQAGLDNVLFENERVVMRIEELEGEEFHFDDVIKEFIIVRLFVPENAITKVEDELSLRGM